jgi:2-dehydropantoate 2-reductase
MRICVFGAGGLGGYFGGRLALARYDVSLIARGAHLAALRENGLRVRSVVGDFEVRLPATDEPAEIGPVDVVFFTVKSYDTESAAARLAPLIRSGRGQQQATAVVSFQNGIDNEEKIAAAVGAEHVVGGVSYIFASIAEPGVISHTGGPASLIFGELSGQRTERLQSLLAACRAANVRAEISHDIWVALWHKYAFLCAMAGMTAAVRLPIGQIRSEPAARLMLRTLLDEGWRVARAHGIALEDDYVERQLEFVDGLEPGGLSSLHHDLVSGHRMELEALHGEMLRRADRNGVEVPMTRAIHAILSPWARRNTRPS